MLTNDRPLLGVPSEEAIHQWGAAPTLGDILDVVGADAASAPLAARDHRAYIDLADNADWRFRQLRAATDPTRLGRAFIAAVGTAGLHRSQRCHAARLNGMVPRDYGATMATTNRTSDWIYLGNRLPEDGAYPPPYDTNGRVPSVRDTKLTLHRLAYGPGFFLRAEYTCVHAKVHVKLADRRPRVNCQVLGCVALALHAWGFTCNCFRADWEAVFGQPPSRQNLNSARHWSLAFLTSHSECWVAFSARRPSEPSQAVRAIDSNRGAA